MEFFIETIYDVGNDTEVEIWISEDGYEVMDQFAIYPVYHESLAEAREYARELLKGEQ